MKWRLFCLNPAAFRDPKTQLASMYKWLSLSFYLVVTSPTSYHKLEFSGVDKIRFDVALWNQQDFQIGFNRFSAVSQDILNPFGLYYDDVGVYTHQWQRWSIFLGFASFEVTSTYSALFTIKDYDKFTLRAVYYSVVFMYPSRLKRHIPSSLPYDWKKWRNFACWFLRMIMMLIEVAVYPYFSRCLLILFALKVNAGSFM